MFRRAIVLLVILLTAGGCTRVTIGVPQGITCARTEVKQAWAVKVSETGSVEWRSRLAPPAPGNLGSLVQPVIADGIAVAATRYSYYVYGLRLADGRLLWTWTDAQEVFGQWLWRSTLVVETAAEGGQVTLTGLDAMTGNVRWSTGLGTDWAGDQLVTADGGLTFLTAADVLETIQFSSGRIRWSVATGVPPDVQPVLAVADGMVVFVADGQATGYDDRTGRVRWAAIGLPPSANVWSAAGLVVVTSTFAGGPSALLTAIRAGTGQVAWQFDAPVKLAGIHDSGEFSPLGLIGSGPAGLLVGDSGPARLYLLNPATGKPRWKQDVALPGISGLIVAPFGGDLAPPGSPAPIVTPSNVVSSEGFSPAMIVDRDTADGGVRWSAPAGEAMAVTGSLVVAADAISGVGDNSGVRLRAYRLSSGQLAWQASLPGSVPAYLTTVPGGLLAEEGVLGPPPSCGS
jgi:outer membrane protein assembly factor BamB